MGVRDRVYSMNMYQSLLNNPLQTLQQNSFNVSMFALPAVADATVANLFFCARGPDIVIDQSSAAATGTAGAPADASIQRAMLVSRMRGSGLAVGAGAGQRHQATNQVNGPGAAADLWVTEVQTGCTVLIIDWGGSQYSMTHLQPSTDGQFNAFGQGLMNLGAYTRWVTGGETFRAAYKNTWLKQEITSIVSNTGGAPQYYIMIQSMFDAVRGTPIQIVGVRHNGAFQFYRQKMQGMNVSAEQLTWCGWYSYLPYRVY